MTKKHQLTIRLILFLIFLCVISINLYVILHDNIPLAFDEAGYRSLTQRYSNYISFHFSIETIYKTFYSVSTFYPPFYMLLQVPLFIFSGGNPDILVILNTIIFILIIFTTYFFSLLFMSATEAFIASFITATSPALLGFSRCNFPVMLLTLSVLLFFYVMHKYEILPSKKTGYYLMLVTAIGFLTKQTFPFYILLPIVFFFFSSCNKQAKIKFIFYLVGGIAVALLWYLPNIISGNLWKAACQNPTNTYMYLIKHSVFIEQIKNPLFWSYYIRTFFIKHFSSVYSLFLVPAAWVIVKGEKSEKYFFISFLIPFLLLSFLPFKQMRYFVPFLPLFAIVLANLFSSLHMPTIKKLSIILIFLTGCFNLFTPLLVKKPQKNEYTLADYYNRRECGMITPEKLHPVFFRLFDYVKNEKTIFSLDNLIVVLLPNTPLASALAYHMDFLKQQYIQQYILYSNGSVIQVPDDSPALDKTIPISDYLIFDPQGYAEHPITLKNAYYKDEKVSLLNKYKNTVAFKKRKEVQISNKQIISIYSYDNANHSVFPYKVFIPIQISDISSEFVNFKNSLEEKNCEKTTASLQKILKSITARSSKVNSAYIIEIDIRSQEELFEFNKSFPKSLKKFWDSDSCFNPSMERFAEIYKPKNCLFGAISVFKSQKFLIFGNSVLEFHKNNLSFKNILNKKNSFFSNFHTGFEYNNSKYDSSDASWKVKKSEKDYIEFILSWENCPVKMGLNIRLTENKLYWDILIISIEEFSLDKIYNVLQLEPSYNSFASRDGKKHFPLNLTSKYYNVLKNIRIGKKLLLFSRSRAFPPLLLEQSANIDNKQRYILQTSSKDRIIGQFTLAAYFSESVTKVFSSKLESLSKENFDKEFQKLCLKPAPIKHITNGKNIIVTPYDGSYNIRPRVAFTKNDFTLSIEIYDTANRKINASQFDWYNSINSDHILSLSKNVRRNIQIKHELFFDSPDSLIWRINTDFFSKNPDIDKACFFLNFSPNKYSFWQTCYEKGTFSRQKDWYDEIVKYGTYAPLWISGKNFFSGVPYALSIDCTAEKGAFIPVITTKKDALRLCIFISKEYIDLEQTGCTDIKISFLDTQKEMLNNIENHKKELSKIIMNNSIKKDNTTLSLKRGSGSLLFKDTEFTKAFGMYTSVRSKDQWFDSTKCFYSVSQKSENSLHLKYTLLYLPITYIWDITLLSDNTIAWNVQMKTHNSIYQKLDEKQINIMLSDLYTSFAAKNTFSGNKLQQDNRKNFAKTYHNTWKTLISGSNSANRVSLAVFSDEEVLPNLEFGCSSSDMPLLYDIQNTSADFKARALKFYELYNQSASMDNEIVIRHFKGKIQIKND